ncbi:pro-neuregulin-2, membrane-bound isoform-like isoform X2 [Uloborus diversus]|uniref:pro-neuregulin-2, membrane-bound isoform-like isoform X2 n=1 Tax=Uloborus diversus TaxID=327109 RepID=UPI0024098782|nr:pro-neuregulin-2, membrane-bound isoform-like isoform X2 [Uloborus diversus]
MNVFRILCRLLLLVLCFCSLCLGSSDVVCLGKGKGATESDKGLPTWAAVTSVQSRALRSQVVFVGTLRSVLVQRDGTVRAWFTVDLRLKPENATWMESSRRLEDTEVVYHTRAGGHCLDQDSLRLGRQYLVFGGPSRRIAWPSLTAAALPIPKDKRTLRAVKKILCPGCARPARVAGLKKVIAEEGARARLSCHLAGNPIPWVEWYKDGKRITSRGRTRVKTKRRISRLVIRRVHPSDRGGYECRAGNAVQEATASTRVTLLVTRKKKPLPTASSTQSSPWTTEPCSTSEFCLNGGTCILYKDVMEYVCHCAEGYVGLRCESKYVTIAEIKNSRLSQNRLFISIVILFVIFFCLNWMTFAVCWLCWGQNCKWGKFREMAARRAFSPKSNSVQNKMSTDVRFLEANSGSKHCRPKNCEVEKERGECWQNQTGLQKKTE